MLISYGHTSQRWGCIVANRYALTHLDLDALTVTDMGTITRGELDAMARLPGWHMVREDGKVWLNVDGRGWEQLHVCKGAQDETQE
jgi:hypothetical protein